MPNPPPHPPVFGSAINGDQPFSHSRDTYNLNNRIMLTAIVSLTFVVVLVVSLHIYARCALRRHAAARRRGVISSLGLTAHAGEPPKTGLDPLVIASLPIFVYKQTEGGQDDGDNNSTECAVCLSILEDQEMARLLPNCKHTFHAECIDKWLSSRSTCPICRTEAEPRVQPEPREGPVGAASTAPTLERVNSTLLCVEGTSSDPGIHSSAKVGGSISRLSSFRRMLSRERSSRRIQYEVQEGIEDLERQ